VTTDESGEQDVATRRPTLVTIAIVLWAVAGILYLGTATILMSSHVAVLDYLMRATPKNYTRDQVNTQLTFEEFASLVVGVVTVAFTYVLMKGVPWARRLLILSAFLLLVCLLLFSIQILSITAGTLIGIVALLLLYLPSVNRYFAALKRQAV
jgi:hypothetical protein